MDYQAAIGFGEGHNDLVKAINAHLQDKTWYLSGSILDCRLQCGAELWVQFENGKHEIKDCTIHFRSANTIRLAVCDIIRQDQSDPLSGKLKCRFMTDAGESDTGEFSAIFDVCNLCLYGDIKENDLLIAQVAAFSYQITYYHDVATFEARHDKALPINAFASRIDRPSHYDYVPEAASILSGIISRVHHMVNEITGNPFYHLEVCCFDCVIDVVAYPELFYTEPQVGGILQGLFWFSVKIIRQDNKGVSIRECVSIPIATDDFSRVEYAIRSLRNRAYEHLVVEIREPVEGIDFIQTAREGEGYRIEVGMNDSKGARHLFMLDKNDLDKTLSIFRHFLFTAQSPDISKWNSVNDLLCNKGKEGK